MSCVIEFTATAKEDLRNITMYIADTSKDISVASRFVNELWERCNILKTFPESGALPKDRVLLSGGYRFLVHKDYLIFYLYKKEENKAYIAAVFNGKRDYIKVMRKLI